MIESIWTHSTQVGMYKTKPKLRSQKKANNTQDNQAKTHQFEITKMVHMIEFRTPKL